MEDRNATAPTSNLKAQDLYAQASQHHDQGRLEEAARAIHRAVALSPHHPEYRRLNKLINDKLYSHYSQLIRQQPDNPQNYLDRGEIYLHHGTVAKALADYNRAIELLSRTIQEHPRMKKPYFDRAYAYRTLELYTKAIEDYSTLLQLYPKDQPARFNRALAYYQLGQYDLAVDDLTECIHLSPSATYFQFRGFAFYSQGDFLNAVDDFTRVLHLAPTPDPSEILYYRGLSFFHSRAYQQAIEDLTHCLEGLTNETNRVNACLVIDTCRTRLGQ